MIMKIDKKNIPELRFSEFEEEWEYVKLGKLLEFKNGLNSDKEKYGHGVKFINVLDIINNPYITYDNIIGKVDVTEKEFEKNKVQFGDILFQRSSETREEVGQSNVYLDDVKPAVFGGFVIRGKKIADYHPLFMKFNLGTDFARKEITTKSGGSTRYNVGQNILKNIEVIVPTIPEQQKIASFLSAVDKKINQLTRKKKLLEQYKKGVMQKIFSQEIRFTNNCQLSMVNGQLTNDNYPDWEEKKLGDVLHEHKLKSSKKEKVFSVSVHKGLINQIEHLGRSFAAANTDNYNLVKPHDIVYTKSPTGNFPLGIIKQSFIKKDVIVSPLYGVFTPETPQLGYMLNVYFESVINTHNYLHSIIQKGAKNTINITNKTFLSKSLKLPVALEEQIEIGNYLQIIDKKIESIQSQLTQTQTFKKGLLQKMFV